MKHCSRFIERKLSERDECDQSLVVENEHGHLAISIPMYLRCGMGTLVLGSLVFIRKKLGGDNGERIPENSLSRLGYMVNMCVFLEW